VKRQMIRARQDEEVGEILLFPRTGTAAYSDDLP
jgi:hypothetical protein